MLEFLYSVVIIVCLAGDCDAFIIDDGVTLADCRERIAMIKIVTPRRFVPTGECVLKSMVI